MATPGNFFRANVGAMIINGQGDVLVFERADAKGAWQMPQGGIEAGELPRDAVMREVFEETGIAPEKLELLAEVPGWLAYELPEQFRSAKTGMGQVQKWFLFRFRGKDHDIQVDAREFAAAKWVNARDLPQMTADFRRPVYQRLLEEFSPFLRNRR